MGLIRSLAQSHLLRQIGLSPLCWTSNIAIGLAILIFPLFAGPAIAIEDKSLNREQVQKLLKDGLQAGSLTEGMTSRVSGCFGGGKKSASTNPTEPDFLQEIWEFSGKEVHRVKYESVNGKAKYRRVESKPFDTKWICRDLLDGKALEIESKSGTGEEVVMLESDYSMGSRSIEVLWQGQTVLELMETNGPLFLAYRESNARLFGALYERLAKQAREVLIAKPKEAGK